MGRLTEQDIEYLRQGHDDLFGNQVERVERILEQHLSTPAVEPIELLRQQVQQFVNAINEENVLVTSGLLVWEQVKFDDADEELQGVPMRRVDYATLTDAGIASCYGLAAISKDLLEKHLVWHHNPEGE